MSDSTWDHGGRSRPPRGLLRPFQRDQKSDIATVDADRLLASHVGQVLGAEGELPWRPELTGNLDRLRNVSSRAALSEFARFYVADALRRWVPNAVVAGVVAVRSERSLELEVRVRRRDDTSPEPRNQVVRVSLPLGR